MKPFDLEAAKNGAPLQTRDGRKARIVCFDRGSENYPIITLTDDNGQSEMIVCHTLTGHTNNNNGPSRDDLFMAPVERTGWVNIYRNGWVVGTFSTKEEADKGAGPDRVAVQQITWTE